MPRGLITVIAALAGAYFYGFEGFLSGLVIGFILEFILKIRL